MEPRLDDRDQGFLVGEAGSGAALAMRVVVAAARAAGAERLIDVASAHIDGCLFHGRAGLDFAERLVEGEAKVRIPTTLNVSSLDLVHPDLYRGDPDVGRDARKLMDAYVALGCRPTWTCAPYQLTPRPARGEDVAWGESNAIAFANSVIGARTDRYGDFIDICAAITGRVPFAGLHVTENRRARIVFDVRSLPEKARSHELFLPVLGHLVGKKSESLVPVIDGLGSATEDGLKAFGAAAASSGAVGLFHATGITPEAPSLEAALQGRDPDVTVDVTIEMMSAARAELSTAHGDALDAVSVGTPHASATELATAAALIGGRKVHPEITFYVSTGRTILEEAVDDVRVLEEAGVRMVTDTCTYITPILDPNARVVMTNSAKWAYYAPGNMGVDVVFGSLAECVESAMTGRVVASRGFDA